MRTSRICPSSIIHELATLTDPPVAITLFDFSSINGFTSLSKASDSIIESTSIATKKSLFDMFMPAFKASAFHPFSLSTISKFANELFRDLYTPLIF